MESHTPVTCSCGKRVYVEDVLQQGRSLRLFGPSLVYLKYRCSHCKRVEERFISEHGWDEEMLRELPPETSRDERERFTEMGEISPDEALDFHARIDSIPLSHLITRLDT
jgi:hypothetical protein